MNKFSVFARITKIDEAKRTVTGVMTSEAADLAGEVMDYDSTKPNILKWSEECAKRSTGKSVGNVRAMHGPIAAGRVTDIVFDDANKSIPITATIDDDNEWNKVLKGTYTGFSIGGSYANKWDDPSNPGVQRYTAKIAEVSLVDSPCNPEATFSYIKADGSSELRKFAAAAVGDTAHDPASVEMTANDTGPEAGNQATAPVATADASNSTAAAATEGGPDFTEGQVARAVELTGAPLSAGITPRHVFIAKALIDRKDEPGVVQALQYVADILDKATGSTDGDELRKGVYNITRLAEMVSCVDMIAMDAQDEMEWEGDKSKVPAMLRDILKQLAVALIAMVKEETDEMLARHETMTAAAPTGDLSKSEERVTDEAIDAMGMDELRATAKRFGKMIDDQLNKAHDNRRAESLHKTLDEATLELRKVSKELVDAKKALEVAVAENVMLKAKPVTTTPRLRVVGKAGDAEELQGVAGVTVSPVLDAAGKVDDAATLIKQVHQAGGRPFVK